jgi:PAS domain S-box-containing protein
VSYWNTSALHESDVWVAHTHEVQAEIAVARYRLRDLEGLLRRYFLTSNEAILGDVREAIDALQQQVSHVETMTDDNPEQLDRIGLLEAESTTLGKAVTSADEANKVGAERTGERIAAMQLLLDAMDGNENDLLARRAEKAASDYRVAITANVVAMLLTLGVIAYAWRLLAAELASRRAAEQKAWGERERFLTTLTSIGDAVIVTDAQGRVTIMNRIAQAMTGWGDEAIGKRLVEVFKIVNESTRAVVESPVDKVLREGTIVGLANHTVLIAKDGRELAIDDSGAPIRDRSGAIAGVVLVFRDIAERRKAEDALRGSEVRFRTMAETIPGILYTADAARGITFINRWFFEYTGLDPATATTVDLAQFVHPEDRPRAEAVIQTMLESQTAQELKIRCRAADGEYRWFLHRATPIDNPNPHRSSWLGVCIEIDDLVRAEESLRDTDARKDQFLAMLAHELRNPLAPISNALQLWSAVGNDAAQMEELREIMERQVQQMIRLIDDLLDLSRITRGKIQLRRQRVDLMTLVNGAIESIEPFLERCGHKLLVASSPEPIFVEADVARLVQVFGNILHNAAKYTGHDGLIDVKVHRDNGQAVVRIRDNGPGIPAHMLGKIFDMFTQVDQTLDRAHGGLGIGLTLVKTLVEMHSGNVSAVSEGTGRGSEFIVRLPALAADAVVDEEDDRTADRKSETLPTRRILVVDDVQASARTLAMMLRSIGQDVQIRLDGSSALEAMVAEQPDVVFMDIAMPGMDGYEVARRARQLAGGQNLTLVALTGYGQEQDRRRAIEAGFDHHIVKPTSIEALEHLLLNLRPAKPKP